MASLLRSFSGLLVAGFLAACAGSGNEGSLGVPSCSEFVDGEPVPAAALTETDNGGPGASCFDEGTNTLVLSAIWGCNDGTSFVGRDDGYYLTSDGIWRAAETNDPDRQAVFWDTCKG